MPFLELNDLLRYRGENDGLVTEPANSQLRRVGLFEHADVECS